MSNILSYGSLVITNSKAKSMFGGSSRYEIIEGELRDKNESIKRKTLEIKKKCLKPEQKELKFIEEKKKTHRLNKSMVIKNCNAFSRLEKSKKFLAFYSISFPKGLPDDNAYKIFNTWLTRCRKNCGLKSYIWVAERQKNLTVHFHLLTNDFMTISQVNNFMAKCLLTEKKCELESLKDVETEKYNGVDVKKVGKNKNGLVSYLTKYVTKNNIEFSHLTWHCSRDVSRLFTSINFERPEGDKYLDQLPKGDDMYNIHPTDYYKVKGFKFRPNDDLFIDLDSVNEAIYNQ
jgi:hypothetical protein